MAKYEKFRAALLEALIARENNPILPHTDDDITAGDIVYVDSLRDHIRRLAIATAVDRDNLLAYVHFCNMHPEDATNRDLVLTGGQTGHLPFLVMRGDVATWVHTHQIWARDGHLPEHLTNAITEFFNSSDRENLTTPDGYVIGTDRLRTGRPLPLTFDPRRATLREELRDLDAMHASTRQPPPVSHSTQ